MKKLKLGDIYNDISELPDTVSYYRFICVYEDLLCDGKWKVVGHKGFKNADEAWAPPKCVIDKITGKGSIYYKGEIRSCSYDECKNLEIAAVWDRHHVIDMLMGNPKWGWSNKQVQTIVNKYEVVRGIKWFQEAFECLERKRT